MENIVKAFTYLAHIKITTFSHHNNEAPPTNFLHDVTGTFPGELLDVQEGGREPLGQEVAKVTRHLRQEVRRRVITDSLCMLLHKTHNTRRASNLVQIHA